ncbi:ABC transporter ATP-binding protein [Tychonema sp. LEGE 07199]|uniref:energy-coupling factor ABC transporter ATP-binding protein n=1 Tax=unclassified Tychonema TaxID=2642144 RepID=UPI00187F8302|nr:MULTISPECIES: ABC transporter ATP-binding protein [unclassified Tychonema]MBE9123617.1 ABC transporter ATP-binding protein [Tychonema sp. LEGE 07199]MBE9133002.1 ABC transporter ATP-binding protein [Tychonema sp. LEGE 07196]
MTNSSLPILEFDRTFYSYPCGSRVAIQDLSLKVPAGKRCGLIGQNGCGKTTFFLLANGLYQPQQGIIRWEGEPFRYDRKSLTQLRQQIGLVFQNPEHQLVASTVEEDISYGLYNLGLAEPDIARMVQEAIDQFDLNELAREPIHNLSLGQKKRVSIADIMVLKPKLLLLDEPTAYLDPRHTNQLIGLLQQIHAAGTTILLASHDLDFIYSWADWVFVMDRGKLVLEGTPETVFAQRDVLEQLQLGVPLAIELMEQIRAIFEKDDRSQIPAFEELQQQILDTRRRI